MRNLKLEIRKWLVPLTVFLILILCSMVEAQAWSRGAWGRNSRAYGRTGIGEFGRSIGSSSWQYFAPIYVDSTYLSETITGYNCEFALNASNFDFSKAKPNGEDIRFTSTNGLTKYPYCISVWDTTNKLATVAFKYDVANGSLGTVYMWCGNASALDSQDCPNSGYLVFDKLATDFDAVPKCDPSVMDGFFPILTLPQIDTVASTFRAKIFKVSDVIYTPNDPIGRKCKVFFACSRTNTSATEIDSQRIGYAWAASPDCTAWNVFATPVIDYLATGIGYGWPSCQLNRTGDSIYFALSKDTVGNSAGQEPRIAICRVAASNCTTGFSTPEAVLTKSASAWEALYVGYPAMCWDTTNNKWALYYGGVENTANVYRNIGLARSASSSFWSGFTRASGLSGAASLAPTGSASTVDEKDDYPISAIYNSTDGKIYVTIAGNNVVGLGTGGVAKSQTGSDFLTRHVQSGDANAFYGRETASLGTDGTNFFGFLQQIGSNGLYFYYLRHKVTANFPSSFPFTYFTAGVQIPQNMAGRDTVSTYGELKVVSRVLTGRVDQSTEHPRSKYSAIGLKTTNGSLVSDFRIGFWGKFGNYAQRVVTTNLHVTVAVGTGVESVQASGGGTNTRNDGLQWQLSDIGSGSAMVFNGTASTGLKLSRATSTGEIANGVNSTAYSSTLANAFHYYEFNYPRLSGADSTLTVWIDSIKYIESGLDTVHSIRQANKYAEFLIGEYSTGEGGDFYMKLPKIRQSRVKEPMIMPSKPRPLGRTYVTVTLDSAGSGVQDTWLQQAASARTQGGATTLLAGRNSGQGTGSIPTLIHASLSSLPVGAVVVDARMFLKCAATTVGSPLLRTRPITHNWVEGTASNANGTEHNSAAWDSTGNTGSGSAFSAVDGGSCPRDATTAWAGVVSSVTGYEEFGRTFDSGRWYSWNVTAEFLMLQAGTGWGVELADFATSSGDHYATFHSSEASTASNRPFFWVTYYVP